jgi:hypothetical protein
MPEKNVKTQSRKDSKMKIFTCTDHDGHNPVGVASVVIAKDRRAAKRLLDKELVDQGLKPWKEEKYTLTELWTGQEAALILHNGSY